jgi:hypothetical protein
MDLVVASEPIRDDLMFGAAGDALGLLAATPSAEWAFELT